MRFLWISTVATVAILAFVLLMQGVAAQSPLAVSSPAASYSPTQLDPACLPHNVFLTDTVISTSDPSITTVEQALNKLNPTCTENGYQNSTAQRVQFYRLGGCHGMDEAAVAKFVQAQESLITKQKEESKYLVIELACNLNTLP